MATQLKDGHSLQREIELHGVGPVVIEITAAGVRMRVKGNKTSVFAHWLTIVERAMQTPENVPAFLMGKPIEFLRRQTQKKEIKAKTNRQQK